MESERPKRPQTWNRYTYSLNNPLRFIDPTGLSALDATYDSEIALEEGYDQATHQREQQTAQQPNVAIKLTVGKLIELNGQEVKLPSGDVVKDQNGNTLKAYGVARIDTFTVSVDGKPADPSTGITVSEGVSLVSATPENAKKAASVYEPSPVPLRPGGVVYDFKAQSTGTREVYENLPDFSIVTKQTVTVNDANGNELAKGQYIITQTKNGENSDIKVQEFNVGLIHF